MFLQLRCYFSLILAGVGFLHGNCLGSPDATNQFRLYTRPRFAQEGGAMTCHVLDTATARYSFTVPMNWAVKEDVTKREVVMMARSLTTSIRFKIAEETPVATSEERVARWRQSVLENHQDGKITEEFKCYASKIEGTAFDLERISPAKTTIYTRLAFIPVAGGRVEFNMTTTAGDPADARQSFGTFLTSFRVEPLSAK
jgi:hypothetical protein